MSETSSRLLELLSLLQGRRDWPGNELAERLEVSGRTVRRDVERLRRLGYPVQSLTGPAGGYRLRAGTAMDLPLTVVSRRTSERLISVDGAWDQPGLNLSHWPGNATPPALRHDLSTGAALAFARLDPAAEMSRQHLLELEEGAYRGFLDARH